jgi:hypothetical protein
MKTSNVHSILGGVYKLLGDYEPRDFARASRYQGLTSNLREALTALTREAEGHHSKGPTTRPSQERANATPGRLEQAADIVALILNSKRYRSTLAILDFARNVGINVTMRPKESRARLAKKVAGAILQLPEADRLRVMAKLGASDDQTQGWIDVIKRSRP